MILVVEDEQITQVIISKFLSSTRFQIDITADAYQALKYIRQNNYSLALIDLVLPGPLNGINLIKQIRKYSPTMKIIACSSYGNQTQKRVAEQAGADMFLLKPFDKEILLSAVNKLTMQNPIQAEKKPATDEPASEEKKVIPALFNGFPEVKYNEIINMGEVRKFGPNDKNVLNFTEYIATVMSGSAKCYYNNRPLGILKKHESIGYEFVTESFDPDALLTVQAVGDLEIWVIRSIDLVKYLHGQKNDLLGLFKINIRTLRNMSLFNRAVQEAMKASNIKPDPHDEA